MSRLLSLAITLYINYSKSVQIKSVDQTSIPNRHFANEARSSDIEDKDYCYDCHCYDDCASHDCPIPNDEDADWEVCMHFIGYGDEDEATYESDYHSIDGS